MLTLRQGDCKLFELYAAAREGSGWHAYSGAVWDLTSNELRPEGWTSADAAGLPILPGLARRDEADAGAIHHALRITVPVTQKAYIHPATHWASSNTDTDQPPMGLRVRLKASYDISGLRGQAHAIAQALKTYGAIVADNAGSPRVYVGGVGRPRLGRRGAERDQVDPRERARGRADRAGRQALARRVNGSMASTKPSTHATCPGSSEGTGGHSPTHWQAHPATSSAPPSGRRNT